MTTRYRTLLTERSLSLGCMIWLAMGVIGGAHSSVHAQQSTGGITCSMEGYIGNQLYSEGYTSDVRAIGETVFSIHFDMATDQSMFVATDFSDPGNPVALGTLVISSEHWNFELGAGLAILALDENGILIIDVSDPADMHVVGMLATSDRVIEICVQDQIAYIIDETDGTLAVDISDPGDPVVLDSFVTFGDQSRLAARDSRLYVSLDTEQLIVVDTSDPTDMREIRRDAYDLLGAASVHIDGDLLVLVGLSRMQMYDLDSGDGELVDLGVVPIYELSEGFPYSFRTSISFQDQHLVMLDEYGCAYRYSFEEPANPVMVGQLCSTGSYASRVAVLDSGIAVVAGSEVGIEILDMPNANTVLPFDEEWRLDSHTEDFAVFQESQPAYDNGLLYVPYYAEDFIGDRKQGIMVIDIQDPSSPEIVSRYSTGPNFVQDIAVRDGIVYLSVQSVGIDIVDMTTPADPRLILSYQVFPDVEKIKIDGDLLWMTVNGDDDALLDISDPKRIDFLSYFPQMSEAYELSTTFSAGLLFVSNIADVDDESVPMVSTIDLSDPIRPVQIDYPTPVEFDTILVEDGVLYGINYDSQTMYCSPIDDLTNYGSVSINGIEFPLSVIDGYAYLHVWDAHLNVIDVNDPYNPALVGKQPLQVYPYSIVGHDQGAFVISEQWLMNINTDTDCGECRADFTGDYVLNFHDIASFLASYRAGDPAADFNENGTLNFLDISAFLSAFTAGCP